MQPLTSDALKIEVDEEGDRFVFRWLGRSDAREPGKVLWPYFESALARAAEKHKAMSLRFEALEHFNSSTISVVIQLVNAARERGVKMTLSYDPSLRWQALSFSALERAMRPFADRDDTSVTFIHRTRD